MLKYFHAFECRIHDEYPMCRALLCVGKSPSTAIAYAWVDTITNGDGSLHIAPVIHDSPIGLDKVKQAINTLCETDHQNETDLFNELHKYMLIKAEQKLTSRQKHYQGQGRKYKTTHYAATDAALASMPVFPLTDLPGKLQAERHEVNYRRPDYDELFQNVTGPKPKWTWEEDYREPEGILNLLRVHAAEAPLSVITVKAYASRRIKRNLKEVRTKTPQARLQHLMEIAQSMPSVDYKAFKRAETKLPFPWHQVVPQWFLENEPPLNLWDATRLAKRPYNEMMSVIADQLTWLHHWYVMQAYIRKDAVGDEVKRFEWNVETQAMDEYPVEYDAEDEFMLCRR